MPNIRNDLSQDKLKMHSVSFCSLLSTATFLKIICYLFILNMIRNYLLTEKILFKSSEFNNTLALIYKDSLQSTKCSKCTLMLHVHKVVLCS